MGGNVFENATESADSNWRVIRDGDMMFAILLGAEPDVGTILTDALIAEFLEGLDELRPVDIARGLHAARTSSRTKCNRIILGMGPGTPSPK